MDRLQALRDTANLPRAVAPPLCSTSTETCMNDSGLDMKMDDSLTDMQWLQGMDAGSEIPGFVQKAIRKRPKTDKENQRPRHNKEGCRKKLDYGDKPPSNSNKPPLSYASLIVLAISSTPQRMLTLSGIYRWIESTFPFYRTPDSKAWKNSIRHNLSIRKNMFVKVYQFPPRRGNGSYWTLLSDGEEELKKAHPLFTTLLPPIIDEDSAYCRVPLTHTVKSRGQFMPVLPHSTRKTPYFALHGSSIGTIDSPIVSQPVAQHFENVVTAKKTSKKRSTKHSNKASASTCCSTPKHLVEHSYSKTVTFEPELQEVEEELAPEDLVESSFISDLDSFENKSKRFCGDKDDRSVSDGQQSKSGSSNLQVGVCDSTTDVTASGGGGAGSPRKCSTPGHSDGDPEADYSLSSLLGSSFLTPMKTAMADIALDAISFSPLYNFVTPQRGGTPVHPHAGTPVHPNTHTPCSHATSNATDPSSSASCTVDMTPAFSTFSPPLMSTSCVGGVPDFDSGVFSPLAGALHFSTPLMKGVSPLIDLPGNVFNTPQSNEGATPLKALDTKTGSSSITPTRNKTGSRQLF